MNVRSRTIRIVAVLGAVTLAGCAPDESHEPPYNKGCPNNQCNQQFNPDVDPDFHPDAGAFDSRPAFVAPQGCPEKRADRARSGLTADEVRALLPGVYRSCSRDRRVQIYVDSGGQLLAQGEKLVLGACGTTHCELAWGSDVGSLEIWTEPTALTFTGGESSDSYVRTDD